MTTRTLSAIAAIFAVSVTSHYAQDTIPTLTIDSTLTVGDSAIFHSHLEVDGRTTFNGETSMRDNATAARDFTVKENAYFMGSSTTYGTMFYPNAPHVDLFGNHDVITRDPLTGALHALPLAEMMQATFTLDCDPLSGNAHPTWHNAPGQLFPACPETFVGVGTTDPQKNLHVTGESLFENWAEFTYTASVKNGLSVGTLPSDFSKFKVLNTSRPVGIEVNQIGNTTVYNKLIYMQYDNPATEIFKIVNTHNTEPTLYMEGNGRLTIHNGTQKIFQLNPDGVLRTRTVMVDVYNWPDYVFTPTYKLRPLSEVKLFIDANGHLPEVPSAEETANEGVDVGEMNKVLLKKVEELTLYIIQQEERIKALEAVIK